MLRPRGRDSAPPARTQGRAEGGAAAGRHQEREDRPRAGPQRERAADGALGRGGTPPDEASAGLHRPSGAKNISEMADVPSDKLGLYNTHFLRPVHFEQRVKHTRWCVLRLPNASMAQQAGMSTEAFEDFYFDVCNLDYPRLAKALKPLVARMEAANEVHITGPETDLRFSIAGIPVVPCSGEMNIPDGEVFTSPV